MVYCIRKKRKLCFGGRRTSRKRVCFTKNIGTYAVKQEKKKMEKKEESEMLCMIPKIDGKM